MILHEYPLRDVKIDSILKNSNYFGLYKKISAERI